MSPPPASFSVVRGSGWLLVGMLLTAAMQLLSAALLGRLLVPQDFGLVATATLVVRMVHYFSQFGLANAVVQKEDLTEADIRVSSALAFWIGLLATGVGMLVAPLAAAALNQPAAVGVARALSVSFLLVGLGAVPLALLRRHLDFRSVAAIEICSYAVGYLLVALTAAVFFDAGVWSLVVGSLVQTALQSAAGLLLAHQRVRLVFWRQRATDLVFFGGRVSLIGFLEFACLQVDSAALARSGSAADLGQYNRANILAYPVVQISHVVVRVLLPAFARMRDKVRLARAYVDALVVMATVSFAAAAVLAAGPGPAVLALLGPQWGAATEVLPWLAAASAVQAVNQLPAALCEARGVLHPKMYIQLVVLVVFVASVVPAVRADAPLYVYAACWLLAELVRQALYLVVVTRRLGMPVAAQFGGYFQAAVVAGLTYLSVTVVDRLTDDGPLPVGVTAVLLLGTGFSTVVAVLACWPTSRLRSVVRDRELLDVLPGRPGLRRLGRRVFS